MKFNLERLQNIKDLTRELAVGLKNLTFEQNFKSFEVVLDISPSEEVSIRNQLSFIPSRYIIVSQKGNGVVTKSNTEWTQESLFMYNHGPNAVSITINFMR